MIEKRREHPLSKSDCYCESHHIVPRCMNGTDEKANIVNLTAREHYIAHILLAKIYNTYGLYYAVLKMQLKNPNHEREFRFNGRLYEKLKIECNKKQSEYRKIHPLHTWLGRHHTEESKKKMSESAKRRTRRPFSVEACKHMSDAHKGKSSGRKGCKLSKEHIEKVRQKNIGKHWFNNDYNEIKAYSCPEGYVKGRLKQTT